MASLRKALPLQNDACNQLRGLSTKDTKAHQGHEIADAFWCRLSLKEILLYSCLFVFIRGSFSLTIGRFSSNDPHGRAGARLNTTLIPCTLLKSATPAEKCGLAANRKARRWGVSEGKRRLRAGPERGRVLAPGCRSLRQSVPKRLRRISPSPAEWPASESLRDSPTRSWQSW